MATSPKDVQLNIPSKVTHQVKAGLKRHDGIVSPMNEQYRMPNPPEGGIR
jgi:hypothetical protein